MASKNTKSPKGLLASALLMLLALLWLTISTPFVYAFQQKAAAMEKTSKEKAGQENNPLAGTNEEKSETVVGSLSEYLHEVLLPVLAFMTLVKYEKCHSADLYFAFHPELLCPPPNGVC